MSIKPSAIYLEAAERIHSGRDNQICYAVVAAGRSARPPVVQAMLARCDALISEDGKLMRGIHFGMPITDGWPEEGRQHRVMALLLMHEIAKDEERRK